MSPGGSSGAAGSSYPDDWADVEKVASFASSSPEPFFAYAGTSILHPPYQTTQYWYNIAAEQPLPEWPELNAVHPCDVQAIMKRGCAPGKDNETAHAAFFDPVRIARVRRVYLASLEEWDAMVGHVVAAVDAAGRRNNTVFVLAADHGDMQLLHQMFYKMIPYDASSRVPLAFAWPGLGAARVVEQPVQLLDIFPTLLKLAALPVPTYADGYDLAPFLAGSARDGSRPGFVISQNHDEDISMSWFLVSNGTHKLIQYGTGAEVPPQLFDLAADPGEMVDLAASAPADVAALDAALRSAIDYPAVARDVARYQRQQLWFWTNSTPDWRSIAASSQVRWQSGWAARPERSLHVLEDFVAGGPDAPSPILPCDGALERE